MEIILLEEKPENNQPTIKLISSTMLPRPLPMQSVPILSGTPRFRRRALEDVSYASTCDTFVR
jgi:hypothetical protein